MALISCPDCGKQISDSASTCIHCGRPVQKQVVVRTEMNSTKEKNNPSETWEKLNKKKNKHPFLLVIGGLFALAILVSVFQDNDFTAIPEKNITDESFGVIYGDAKGKNAKIMFREKNINVVNGTYKIKIPLKMGDNEIVIKYINEAKVIENSVSITRVTTKELEEKNRINPNVKTINENDEYKNALIKINGVGKVAQVHPPHLILRNREYSWYEISRIANSAINIGSRFDHKTWKVYIIDYAGYVVAETSFRMMSNDHVVKYYQDPVERPRFYE